MRETLVKLLFVCNSVEEGQGETKRSPFVWPDHQHYLIPAAVLRLSPKQRLTKWVSLVSPARSRDLPEYQKACVVRMRDIQLFHDIIINCLFMQSKSLLNGILKFVLINGQNLNFTAFHLGVKVSEICHKLSQPSTILPLLQGAGYIGINSIVPTFSTVIQTSNS